MVNTTSKIYIAGHKGMVGSACWRQLSQLGFKNLIGKTSKELDLRDQKSVNDFISTEKPDLIINAAAKVGGILANHTYPYDFLMDNMLIQNNLIKSSHDNDVMNFIFLGSSCIYPKLCKQPIKETYLLTDSLEPTNQWYAIAKISGVKLIESLRKQYHRNYFSLMPTNLYGPEDNFDLKTSHVLPAMIRKFYEAKSNLKSTVKLWGTGAPLREFLHVDDLAKAVIFTISNPLDENLYNVGVGYDISIKNLSVMIKNIIGFKGEIVWDKSKPDGTPKKLMDSSKLRELGWSPKISLEQGIIDTVKWYSQNIQN